MPKRTLTFDLRHPPQFAMSGREPYIDPPAEPATATPNSSIQ
jgi:hypothetical protein